MAAVTTLEDRAYVFKPADFGFTDPLDAPANALLAVRITQLPLDGTLTLHDAPLTAGTFVTAADLAADKLRFTPALDESGRNYASVTFQVQDDGGTARGGRNLDRTPNTLTFDVTSVNDAPAGLNQVVTLLEDERYVFSAADFRFSLKTAVAHWPDRVTS